MSLIEIDNLVVWSPSAHRILDRVSLSVGTKEKLALIGPNGSGKSTFLNVLAGHIKTFSGAVKISQSVLLVKQQYNSGRVLDIVLAPHSQLIKDTYEVILQGSDNSNRYLRALEIWDDLDGYSLQVEWDELTLRTCGVPFEQIALEGVGRLSVGERKLLALQSALRSRKSILLFDEPESALDIVERDLLEQEIKQSDKTIIFCSHDRRLLANYVGRFLVFEPRRNGTVCWEFMGSFSDLPVEQQIRLERINVQQEQQKNERLKLELHSKDMSRRASYNDKMSTRSRSAKTRLERFNNDQTKIYKRELRPSVFNFNASNRRYVFSVSVSSEHRMGKELSVTLSPGTQVGLVGRNGSGKSTLLASVARHLGMEINMDDWLHTDVNVRVEEITSTGLPPKVGIFSQDNLGTGFAGRTVLDIACESVQSVNCLRADDLPWMLNKIGIAHLQQKRYEELSGGERARVQLMILTLSEFDLLLLDEPTENLDIDAAIAFQSGINDYSGCVIVASHDRELLESVDYIVRLGH